MKNIRVFFCLKIFSFLEVIFSIHLKRRVFVMMFDPRTNLFVVSVIHSKTEIIIKLIKLQ